MFSSVCGLFPQPEVAAELLGDATDGEDDVVG